MAITNPTLLATNTDVNQTTSTINSGSFTPSANALLIVVASGGWGNTANLSPISFSGGSLTWTVQETLSDNLNGGAFDWCIAIATAQVGASPGSMSVTATYQNNSSRSTISVFEVTGHDQVTPVTQSKIASSGSTGPSTHSVTLDNSPASDSLIAGGCVVQGSGSGFTPGEDFTEISDIAATDGANNDTYARCQTQYRNGSADTVVDWTLPSLDGNDGAIGCAIEIAAEAGAGGAVFLRRTLMHAGA